MTVMIPHGLFVDPNELDLCTGTYNYSLSVLPNLKRSVLAIEHHKTLLYLTIALSAIKDHGRLKRRWYKRRATRVSTTRCIPSVATQSGRVRGEP